MLVIRLKNEDDYISMLMCVLNDDGNNIEAFNELKSNYPNRFYIGYELVRGFVAYDTQELCQQDGFQSYEEALEYIQLWWVEDDNSFDVELVKR